jgi:hypothetical protein
MNTLHDLVKLDPGLLPYLPYALAAIGVVAAVMPWLPPPSNPKSVYGVIYGIMNAVAQNYRNARNASPKL